MFEYIQENIYVILTVIFFMSTLYFAIKSYNLKVVAEVHEEFIQAEQERISDKMLNIGIFLGIFRVQLMNSNKIDEFNNLLSTIQSDCDEHGIPISKVISDELLATKKKELTQ